jgi:hypothetical protein
MTTSLTPTDAGPVVDLDQRSRHLAEMYRDVANEAIRDVHFRTGRGLVEPLATEEMSC